MRWLFLARNQGWQSLDVDILGHHLAHVCGDLRRESSHYCVSMFVQYSSAKGPLQQALRGTRNSLGWRPMTRTAHVDLQSTDRCFGPSRFERQVSLISFSSETSMC